MTEKMHNSQRLV